MGPKLFIDTWGWLTLRDKREARHHIVANFYSNFHSQGGLVYTTDYVLNETFTMLYNRLEVSKAKESLEMLIAAVKHGDINLIFITPDRFTETVSWRIKFDDKPRISFCDFFSMVVMEEFGISQILTADAHFSHVGKGFQIVP